MHELAITKELIRMVKEEAKRNGLKKVKSVAVELGKLTSYKKDPVEFYFGQLKKEDDLLAEAEIEIDEVDGELRCSKCGNVNAISEPILPLCAECDSAEVEIISGKDITIKELRGE
jgi:hydrogenase nickel incorporation protein HypA/HybF